MSWDMAIIQESPWYKQIVAESEQRGELRGQQRGKIISKLSDIQTSLEVKFGDQGLELMPQISQICDLERLSAIFRCILTSNSLEGVRSFLQE
jgi:predicted transposase YdaD